MYNLVAMPRTSPHSKTTPAILHMYKMFTVHPLYTYQVGESLQASADSAFGRLGEKSVSQRYLEALVSSTRQSRRHRTFAFQLQYTRRAQLELLSQYHSPSPRCHSPSASCSSFSCSRCLHLGTFVFHTLTPVISLSNCIYKHPQDVVMDFLLSQHPSFPPHA